ncbi:3'-5' exonuclease [Leptolyngbya sp. CCNP1308]|uniref:3'-5' exonuclease n=1 Tax=Leptolyngbya sp. CCNP1308 TaxID=3110255 RepID=UPI002B202197|nr:3'-5' exonuclease [Leptolyngbya sp. CCNP1308]MEA5448290.1 3'-5' exonuclease [Leptolyngbya sp. CCNP1308]
MMTMHASKGLVEFPVVFISMVDYLPNRYNDMTNEARSLYVAMTRAIEVLVLSCNRLHHLGTNSAKRINSA